MSAILGPALDDFVGAVLAKKTEKGALDQTDREFLETEVRALKEKLREYEKDANESSDHKKGLQNTLDQQAADQKDIFQYLNGELAKKTDEIVALEERVLKLEEENDMQIREHEGRLLSQKDAADQEIARLHKEIAEYREQLEKVSTFIEYKQTLEAQLQEKKRLLDEEAPPRVNKRQGRARRRTAPLARAVAAAQRQRSQAAPWARWRSLYARGGLRPRAARVQRRERRPRSAPGRGGHSGAARAARRQRTTRRT